MMMRTGQYDNDDDVGDDTTEGIRTIQAKEKNGRSGQRQVSHFGTVPWTVVSDAVQFGSLRFDLPNE